MDRQKDIEPPGRELLQHEGKVSLGVLTDAGATMILADVPGKPAETMGIGIANLYVVTVETQRGDRLTGLCAGALGQ